MVDSEYISRSTTISSNTSLTYFSAKIAFRVVLYVRISTFIKEMKIAGKNQNRQKNSTQQTTDG